MTNKEKRQERFLQKRRFKKRVLKSMQYNRCIPSPRILGLFYKTRTLCSCPTCGNPRKYGGITLQEKSCKELLALELTSL